MALAQLPLFPLGTVLFPGLVLPLHVFEERYRALVRDLMDQPADQARQFGVVAIQQGWEVERQTRPDGAPVGSLAAAPVTLHDVGCTAELRQITERPDGRFDIVTVGRRRFRITSVDSESSPYLTAQIEYLDESIGEPGFAEHLAPRVLASFRGYLGLVGPGSPATAEQLPEDPTVLSHLVAATAMLTLDERQQLLAIPDTAARLRAELVILEREAGLLRRVRAVPVPMSQLAVPSSPN
ncbi:MAG TPA: LON peptidase substrate-binding domain-containing protein [Micromonosporaceae bacterium]|nr:LON peptidase substrate-binding domain-containing protein [Micromonosporaceae bacterium]